MVRIISQQQIKEQVVPLVAPTPEPVRAVPVPVPASEQVVAHPLSMGEFVDVDDTDGLIELYESLDIFDKQVYATKLRIRELLAARTEGDAKTRRVRGRTRVAVITMPDDSWEQSILKEAWNAFPDLADDVLAISSLRVKIREFKKLVNTSGDASFSTFRDMVTGANRGPIGTPTIKIEK